MFYIGVVEDRDDPKQMGRVRVRIMGHHTQNISDLPTEDLPWATVMLPTTSPSVSGLGHNSFLVTGSWVGVMFNDQHMQDPIVIGAIPGYPDQKLSPSVGFSDPTGVYPKWTGDSDVSYSARSSQFRNSLSYANKTRLRDGGPDIQVAIPPKVTSVQKDKDDAYYEQKPWNEPPVSNDHLPSYPDNHVYETESGHVVEFDDTLDNKRYHRYHPAGSFEEIYDDGTRMIKVVGQDYEMILNGKNMYVSGNLNVTVTGNMRQLVYGNYHLEVEKDFTINVKGSIQQKVGGNWECEIVKNRSFNIGANDNLTVMQNQVVTVMENKNDTIEGTYKIQTTGDYSNSTSSNMFHFSALDMNITTLAELNVTAQSNVYIETPVNVFETFGGNHTIDVTGNVSETTGGNQTTQITGNLDVDAARIDFN